MSIVVFDRLMPGDVAHRAQRGPSDLAHPLGKHVGGGEDLLGLLIEECRVAKCGPLMCQWKFLIFR